MSSRVMLPDDPRPVSPVVWRQVGPGLTTAPTENRQPDSSARAVEIEREHQQKIREAHDAGVREGEAAGRKRAAAELQPVMERLGRSIDQLANLRTRLRHEAEADVVKLALAIARRVVRRELSADPDALRGLVVAGLEKLQGQEISRVSVHPSHVAILTSYLQQALNGRRIDIIPDASREPGSVVFETSRGNLDASVDAQLDEIERGLADRLRKQS